FSEAKEELGFLFVQPEHGSHFCRHVPAQGSLSDGHVQQITRIADPGFASEFPIGIVGAFGLESLKGRLQKRPKVIILIDVGASFHSSFWIRQILRIGNAPPPGRRGADVRRLPTKPGGASGPPPGHASRPLSSSSESWRTSKCRRSAHLLIYWLPPSPPMTFY